MGPSFSFSSQSGSFESSRGRTLHFGSTKGSVLNADTRMSSEDPTPEEREMIERMVAFSKQYPHHLPWEKLVAIARDQSYEKKVGT